MPALRSDRGGGHSADVRVVGLCQFFVETGGSPLVRRLEAREVTLP